MNIPIDVDKVNKIQKVITLLDTTIKMLNSLISLKNTLKKEIFPEKEKEEKKEDNNNSTNNTNQMLFLKENSFDNYVLLNKRKKK